MYQNEYIKEKNYTISRIWIVLSITIFTFLFLETQGENLDTNYFFLKILLVVLSTISIFHYQLLARFPQVMVDARKFFLLVLDLLSLTLAILLLNSLGIFLFPLYVIIIMVSSVSFGFLHFYTSLFLSVFSWLVLVKASSYWMHHTDTVAVFAITSFIVPLIYSRHLYQLYGVQNKLHDTLKSSTHHANYDMLTGLANRKHYEEYMKELLDKKTFFALLFIDLNKFKPINDTYGHDVGDKVLIEVAKRLNASIDDGDMVARLGGDEFVIITQRKRLFLGNFINKIEKSMIKTFKASSNIDITISLSMGISIFPVDSTSETFLRKYADEAMYVAKKDPNKSHAYYSEI